MKFADRLKFNATIVSAGVLNCGAALSQCRSLATVIAEGAGNPNEIAVNDVGVPFSVYDGSGNWEEGLYTITSGSQITRTSVLRSSAGGTNAATFVGTSVTVYNFTPGSFLTTLLSSADGVAANTLASISSLTAGDTVLLVRGGTLYQAAATLLSSTSADTTPPTFVSAQVANSTPTVVQVTMSEPLGSTPPPASALAVSKNGGAVTVSSVTTSGSVMLVTVASAFVSTDSNITVTYTKPSNGNMLTDAASPPNPAASFGPSAVTNNVSATPDTTKPTASSAAVANASPTIVAVTMSEAMNATYVPAAAAFTVSGHTVSAVAVSGSAINLTVDAFVNGEAARTVSYTQPGTNNARDLAGNLLDNFTGLAITNNVQAAAQTITVNTPATQTSGASFTVTGSYANGTPSALEYRRSDDAAGVWTAAQSPVIAGGNFSFSVTAGTATANRTISVRDAVTYVSGTSGSYVVNAASSALAIQSITATEDAPGVIRVKMNKAIDTTKVPAATAFTGITSHTVNSVSTTGTDTYLINIFPGFWKDEPVRTVTYTKPGTNPITSADGTETLSTFTQNVIVDPITTRDYDILENLWPADKASVVTSGGDSYSNCGTLRYLVRRKDDNTKPARGVRVVWFPSLTTPPNVAGTPLTYATAGLPAGVNGNNAKTGDSPNFGFPYTGHVGAWPDNQPGNSYFNIWAEQGVNAFGNMDKALALWVFTSDGFIGPVKASDGVTVKQWKPSSTATAL